jgi:hypothetical protein
LLELIYFKNTNQMENINLLNANQLPLARCPHCSIAKPLFHRIFTHESTTHDMMRQRYWSIYVCATCGGVVTCACNKGTNDWTMTEIYPEAVQVDLSIPEPARNYLQQALETTYAPTASVMICATSIDAMLKSIGYTEGALYSRISKAAEDHVITNAMAEWAHEIRLDANDQRHADLKAPLAKEVDAMKPVEFALALAEFLFVLPARVQRGRQLNTLH